LPCTYSIAKVLKGEINPSGRLVDTFVYDNGSHPSVANTGHFEYVNEAGEGIGRFFTNNLEGIYVGYRYFETFIDDEDYYDVVQYPFGYGLSYTTFDQKIIEYDFNNETIKLDVEVTNVGNAIGKDVVQVYFSAPYYVGGIEKPAKELAAYGKTRSLNPGESEILSIEFKTEDMASYDDINEGAWVMDAGEYEIILSSNAHEFIEALSYTVNEQKVFKEDDSTGYEIKNLFSDARGNLEYMSRSNGILPTAPNDYTAPKAVMDNWAYENSSVSGAVPETGIDHGLTIDDLKGVSYDDPIWDKFIEQLTVDELVKLAGDGGYWSVAIERLGLPDTTMYDGPACIRSFLEAWSTVAFPISTNTASTWNDELIEKMGLAMGQEAAAYGVNASYAPSINMHRSPLGGRNFEYYSEDPYVTGKIAAAYVRGLQSTETVAIVKHFAANDQETNRANHGLYVWDTEQAFREIYLEAFEIVVKESNPHGMMSAFNRIGTTWAGGSYELLTELLRNEWGFEGFVITDAGVAGQGHHFDALQAVKAGNDMMLAFMMNLNSDNQYEKQLKKYLETDGAGTVEALQNAAHNIIYYVLHTNEVK